MKKTIASTVAGAALVLCAVASASAADHDQPGIPGTKNCKGQTTAYLAQAAKTAGVNGFRGFAGVAIFNNTTVQELQALAKAYCGN